MKEKILKLQENKDMLIKDFINDDLSNSGLLKSLSDKDIIDLFYENKSIISFKIFKKNITGILKFPVISL